MKIDRNILYLKHILDAIDKISRYQKAATSGDINVTAEAIVFNLIIIGEAARNLSDDVKECYPDIAWKKIIGARNVMVHNYEDIDYVIIDKIVTDNLPNLRNQIKKIIQDIEKP